MWVKLYGDNFIVILLLGKIWMKCMWIFFDMWVSIVWLFFNFILNIVLGKVLVIVFLILIILFFVIKVFFFFWNSNKLLLNDLKRICFEYLEIVIIKFKMIDVNIYFYYFNSNLDEKWLLWI